MSPQYDWVLGIYSNYGMSHELLEDIEDMGGHTKLFRKLTDELGLPATRIPEWHFDRESALGTVDMRGTVYVPLDQEEWDQFKSMYAQKGVDMEKVSFPAFPVLLYISS